MKMTAILPGDLFTRSLRDPYGKAIAIYWYMAIRWIEPIHEDRYLESLYFKSGALCYMFKEDDTDEWIFCVRQRLHPETR